MDSRSRPELSHLWPFYGAWEDSTVLVLSMAHLLSVLWTGLTLILSPYSFFINTELFNICKIHNLFSLKFGFVFPKTLIAIQKFNLLSLSFQKVEIHKENECRIFREGKIKFPPKIPTTSGEELCCIIGMLRGLELKSRSESKFEELMRLQSWFSYPNYAEMFKKREKNAMGTIRKLFKGLKVKHSEEELKKIFRISEVNKFLNCQEPFSVQNQ